MSSNSLSHGMSCLGMLMLCGLCSNMQSWGERGVQGKSSLQLCASLVSHYSLWEEWAQMILWCQQTLCSCSSEEVVQIYFEFFKTCSVVSILDLNFRKLLCRKIKVGTNHSIIFISSFGDLQENWPIYAKAAAAQLRGSMEEVCSPSAL